MPLLFLVVVGVAVAVAVDAVAVAVAVAVAIAVSVLVAVAAAALLLSLLFSLPAEVQYLCYFQIRTKQPARNHHWFDIKAGGGSTPPLGPSGGGAPPHLNRSV